MKKIDKRINKGTWVLLKGINCLVQVTEVHESRKWIQVTGWCGLWQNADIIRFTNKTTV